MQKRLDLCEGKAYEIKETIQKLEDWRKKIVCGIIGAKPGKYSDRNRITIFQCD